MVSVRFVTREGALTPPTEIPRELSDRIKSDVKICVGPLAKTDLGSFKGSIEIGAGIYEAISRYSQRTSAKDFRTAFSELLSAALQFEDRKDGLLISLEEAEQTVLELKLVFQWIRGMTYLWQAEGMPTKEFFDDLQCGFITMFGRLESTLRKKITDMHKAI